MMKKKTYDVLFRFFSFLADRTNGQPLFVKCKILIGTLILGLTTSCSSDSKEDNVLMCYDPVFPNDTIESEWIEPDKVEVSDSTAISLFIDKGNSSELNASSDDK